MMNVESFAASYRPYAVAVTFRAHDDAVEIALTTGVALVVPRSRLAGLECATVTQAEEIEIAEGGAALCWPQLGVEFDVSVLLDDAFGVRERMAAMGRKGGARRSAARAVASRENGKKGGRPKKKAA